MSEPFDFFLQSDILQDLFGDFLDLVLLDISVLNRDVFLFHLCSLSIYRPRNRKYYPDLREFNR